MDANSGNDDNGPNGLDTNASDGHEGVHFGWSDELVDEDSYKAHEDSGESGWLGREKLLSDDDDEVNAIGAHFRVVKKKIRNKTVQTSDLEPPLNLSFVVENENEDRNAEAENEANRNIPAESGVNEKEADGNGENEADGADENDTEENEASSVGLSTGEETDYLGSSDVENYETDSTSEDGDFVSSKTSKILFDSSTSEPRFELGMIFENGKQFKDALYAYVVAHRFDFLSIRIVPKLRLVDMMRLGREELNVELNKQLCSRAKKWAEEKIKGNIIHEFNRLFDYVLALRTVDPQGSFDLVVERPTAADIPKFRRLYVCFGALKEGFKRDSNNQIFPIAWAWFLNHLQNDFNLGNGDNLTLLSDMQKVQNHANQRSPMPTHTGPSSSIPFDPPPSTEPYSSPHSTIPSIGPFSPTHSTIPSAPQPSTGPFSPPHSTIPSTPPMVFMPTPSIQPSLAFDSASPPVTRITTFSPKTKVTANRIPLYRRSREHVTSSTTVMPHVSSQPTATVSVPQEGIPPKLTIWRP
ncbi:hypothetical protein V6N12_070038 [Hibiscus sabdariffa]|uniref:Uncharacterized protein n=1 Tax=Hibiscus sabdariffa TaxID=183260 RepID=A0ABR2FFQ6_9ROSI